MKDLSADEQMNLWRDLVQNNSPCEVVTNSINDQLNEWKCENQSTKKHGQKCVNCKYDCDQKKCDLCCKTTYLKKLLTKAKALDYRLDVKTQMSLCEEMTQEKYEKFVEKHEPKLNAMKKELYENGICIRDANFIDVHMDDFECICVYEE